MRVIIAAGGTAGHINPGLAIAGYIKNQQPDSQILFVGRKDGMERSLTERAGYPFRPIEVTGFQRKISFENLKRNVVTVKNLMFARGKAKKIIKDFGPDLVVGTGGYVSGPIVLEASQLGIKTAIHEQNAFPGITNKMLSRNADRVFIATQAAAKYMAHPEKCIVCGNPVRQRISSRDPVRAKRRLGVEGKICLLSFGGSLGRAAINRTAQILALHNRDRKDIVHFHVTGRYDEGEFPKFLKENGLSGSESIRYFEYLYDIPQYMAAADLIISRCGALTIAEIACMGKASILIPSPNVAENHQFYNGKVLSDIGAAVMIEERDLTEKLVTDIFDELTEDPERLKMMGEKAKDVYNPDCLRIIYNGLVQ